MRNDCLSQRRCCARCGGVGESLGLLQLNLEWDVVLSTKVPSREGTMVAQRSRLIVGRSWLLLERCWWCGSSVVGGG